MGEHVGTTTIFHFKEPLTSDVSTPEELYDKLKNNLGNQLISDGAEIHGKSIEYKLKAQWMDTVYNISVICNPDHFNKTDSVKIEYSTKNNKKHKLSEEERLSDAEHLLKLIRGEGY